MRRLPAVPAVAACLAAAGAIAWGVLADARDSRLAALLREVDAAEEHVAYEGVRRFGTGADAFRLRVWSRGGEKRMLPAAAGSAPGGRAPRPPLFDGLSMFLKPEPGFGRRTERERRLTLRNYELVRTGSSVVAGRAAELWELRPRHEGRSSYAVAVDAGKRLLLSLEARRGDEVLFSMGFDEITFDPEGPAPERGGGRRGPRWLKIEREPAAPERLSEAAGFPVWLPSQLPAGFELRESEVVRVRLALTEEQAEAARKLSPVPLPRFDGAVAKVSYTDGLAFLACVQVPAASEYWQFVKRFIPAGAPEAPAGKVVARKFPDRGGAAYLLELGESVVFMAGNAAPPEMESMIRTFERR